MDRTEADGGAEETESEEFQDEERQESYQNEDLETAELDDENVPIDNTYQPLLHMSAKIQQYEEQLMLLNSKPLLELADTGFLDDVERTVGSGKVLYENCEEYVNQCIESVQALSEVQIALVKTYREKIEEESKEMLTKMSDNEWKNWDEAKMTKARDDASKFERFSAIARSIGDLQKFVDKLNRAFNTLNGEIERVKAESLKIAEEEERLRREEEARVKAEEERKRKAEEERLRKEEEERAQREEEERKRLEEEERKRLEEERRARREEEARKRKEEEEEHRRKEEEERKRLQEMANPVNWEAHRYEAESKLFTQSLVLRVPKEEFNEADVAFRIVDQNESSLKLGPDEELMSEIIEMQVKNEEQNIKYEVPSWLALAQPSFQPSHRETVVMCQTEEGEWEELITRPAKIPSVTDSKYVETSFTELRSATLAVVSRLKVDTKVIFNKTTKLESSVDSRVRVICQKGSVRFNANVSLTVLPVQSYTVDRVKDKNATTKKMLSSIGHLISIKADRKMLLPVTVNLPMPGGRKGKELPSASRQSGSLSARSERSQVATEEEPLFVAWKGQNKWHHTESPEVTVVRDVASFEIDTNKVDRFLLMKTNQQECSSSTISSMASQIEESTRVTPIQMVARQKSAEKSCLYLQVCSSENTEREVAILKQNGYDTGPMPSAEVEMREGQELAYHFSGNILPEVTDHIGFTFNCNLRNNMRELFIKEKDVFYQKSSDEYRGYAELWVQDSEEGQRALVKMPLTLPKVYSRDDNIPRRTPIPPSRDPILTEELFRTFSHELVDDWQKLARALKIKQSLLPSIKLQHVDDEEEAVYELLKTWYSRSPVMSNKVNTLRSALKVIHRYDLARILDQDGQGWDKEKKVWNLVFRQLSREHAGVVKEWAHLFRVLAENLNMDAEVVIHDIRQRGKDLDRDCCSMVLRKWREMGGSNSTPYGLVAGLKDIDNVLAAEEVEDIFKRNDMM